MLGWVLPQQERISCNIENYYIITITSGLIQLVKVIDNICIKREETNICQQYALWLHLHLFSQTDNLTRRIFFWKACKKIYDRTPHNSLFCHWSYLSRTRVQYISFMDFWGVLIKVHRRLSVGVLTIEEAASGPLQRVTERILDIWDYWKFKQPKFCVYCLES